MGLGDWLGEPRHGRVTGFSVHGQTGTLDQPVPPRIYGSRGYEIPRPEADARLL